MGIATPVCILVLVKQMIDKERPRGMRGFSFLLRHRECYKLCNCLLEMVDFLNNYNKI